MRRPNFLVAALAAIVTFTALSAFVRRPWGWHRGWGYHRCYEDERYYDRGQGNAPGHRQQAPITDTTPFR